MTAKTADELRRVLLDRLGQQAPPGAPPPALDRRGSFSAGREATASTLARLNDEPLQDRRSHQTFEFARLLFSEGHSDDEVAALLPQYPPAAEKYAGRLDKEIEALTGKLRPLHVHVGATCGQASCPNRVLGISGAREMIGALQRRGLAADWTGRTGTVDRAALMVGLGVAARRGNVTFGLSDREFAELLVCDRKTARAAAKRLQACGYWERTPGRGSHGTTEYRLRTDLTGPFISQPNGRMNGPFASAHDLFSRKGLNKTAPYVYEVLLRRPAVAKEIANAAGIKVEPARRALRRLEAAGMTRRSPNGVWSALTCDLDLVAQELGATGELARRKQRHAVERQLHADYIEAVEEKRQADEDGIRNGSWFPPGYHGSRPVKMNGSNKSVDAEERRTRKIQRARMS